MAIQDLYQSIGGSYDEALKHMMREALVEKYTKRFTGDPSYNELKTAIEAKDYTAAFSAAHTLKGVSLNLGFAVLGKASSELTEYLRPQNSNVITDSKVIEMFAPVKDAYEAVINALNAYFG